LRWQECAGVNIAITIFGDDCQFSVKVLKTNQNKTNKNIIEIMTLAPGLCRDSRVQEQAFLLMTGHGGSAIKFDAESFFALVPRWRSS
jgi:hypothetical protein